MAEYIEREAAIERLAKLMQLQASTARAIIEAIPAADVRPNVTDRWIDYQQGRWIYAKCPKCETVHNVRSNYCPNCGAKMGGQDDV